MKHIIYSALILLLASACNKPVSSPEEEQYAKYIFFSQQVETKATLVESDKDMTNFGVVGFKYEGEWDGVKASSEPNVFYDDNGNIETPETLTCNGDGTADYAPLQGWSSFKKYAFFAYYPIGHDALRLVNFDGKEDYTAGVPAIKYTMDQSDLKGSMVDVMTAPAQTGLHWKSSAENNSNGGEVTFSFAHRLSSLGVKVKNSSSGDIVLNSVSLNISGIRYQSIVIPLDGSPVTKTAFASAHASEMALAKVAETSLTAGGESELADKLIFIPQDENLTAKVTIGYTRNAVGEDPYSYEGYTETRTLPAQTTILEEGKKHLILLNFTDSTVEIKGLANTGWVDLPEVEDTFN